MLVLPSSIDSYITAREHFGALEGLLAGSVEELERLKKQRPKFGEKLTQKKLEELAPTIVDKARLFLDVPTRPPYKVSLNGTITDSLKSSVRFGMLAAALPAIFGGGRDVQDTIMWSGIMGIYWTAAYFLLSRVIRQGNSHYRSKEHTLVITARDTVSAVEVVAHEYTHRLQDYFRITYPNDAEAQLNEGNSFRVASHITTDFTNATGNQAYLFYSVHRSVKDLGYAYNISARQNKLPTSKALKKYSGIFGIFPPTYWWSHGKGYAAIHLAEALHGEGVQKLAVRADYSFMAHPLTTQARAH